MTLKNKKEKGFTMVELLVAMSVFAVILTVAVGIFVRTTRTQRRLVHRMGVNNNAGLVLEQMTRQIRTGYFFCGDPTSACGNRYESTSSISFVNHEGNDIKYFLDEGSGVVKKMEEGNTVSVTASDVLVKDLNYRIKQADSEKCNPWRITIRMRVGSEKTDPKQDIKLQNTISSRVLPVEAPGAPQEVINDCQ